MPWKETSTMDQRIEFIAGCLMVVKSIWVESFRFAYRGFPPFGDFCRS